MVVLVDLSLELPSDLLLSLQLSVEGLDSQLALDQGFVSADRAPVHVVDQDPARVLSGRAAVRVDVVTLLDAFEVELASSGCSSSHQQLL